jgi:hypothetical protein
MTINILGIAAHRAALLSGTALFGAAILALVDPQAASADQQFLKRGSLLISSTTYDNTQGRVKFLAAGSALPGPSTAVAGNDYVHVWNNASVDASFGITSAIQLTDINLSNGNVFRMMQVPTDQVVTSFSSKSELGLHVVKGWPMTRVVFVAYASPGVGAIDVSNSDAVPGQDPTNPVTAFFGNNYAFGRTIVSVDEKGSILYTPTINYGGNNGRNALFGSNGLYYTVGNANNGNAATFGTNPPPPPCPPANTTATLNCTNPDVTQTTGLEVVNPIDSLFASTTPSAGNSAQVDPLLQWSFGNPPKPDKAGKDNNYRGITEYGGALYFTKGSGSNGYQTVYTITSAPSLPTVGQASAAKINIVPGFPNDQAKAKLADGTSGGNFTPFAVFFANPTTMYVTDEGTGNSTDVSTNAGLEKWSLGDDGVTWHLDYVLTNGLIHTGTVDNVTGSDGAWPAITTIGLRNMDGRINGDGTVTIWAVTSTSSASGDNGADPNKVVQITDQIAATTSNAVANESFTTVAGPTYGTVFRGVGFIQ